MVYIEYMRKLAALVGLATLLRKIKTTCMAQFFCSFFGRYCDLYKL